MEKKMSLNKFLNAYNSRIINILRECEEYRFKGSYGGSLNLGEIINIMNGLKKELQNLTEENHELKRTIYNLEDENKRLKLNKID